MTTNKKKAQGRANDYRHIDKDPVIDLIRTAIQEKYKLKPGGKITHAMLAKLSLDAGPSVGMYVSWLFGGTRRPQHLTVRFTLEALGLRSAVLRADGSEMVARR